MRQRYRNRPIFGLVFWSLLFGGATLYAAWKFDWVSIDLAEMTGRRSVSPDTVGPEIGTAAQQAGEAPAESALGERAVFTDQTEPPTELAADETSDTASSDPETSDRLRLLQQQRRVPGDGTAANRPAVAPDEPTRMPDNPFRSDATFRKDDTPRLPAKNGDFADGDDSPSDSADLRPRGNNRTEAARKSSPPVGNGARRVEHGQPSRNLQQPEWVQQTSNEEPQAARHDSPQAARNDSPQVAAPKVPAAAAAALRDIDRLLDTDDISGAHRDLSKLYWGHPELRSLIRPRIEKTAQTIYFSPQPHFLEPYVVQPEDQFAKFAKTYDVPWQYLAKLNRVDPQRIRPGQKLKVIRGPFSAVVELSRFELTVHAHGYFVRRYDVGIGKQGSSPVGKHTVHDKVVNPQYTDPEGRVIDAEDPDNPLGERWIDLGDGYGIHGTIEPDSIGKAQSRGCIRLRNEDVEDLFDLLSVGSDVVIRP